MLFFLFYRKTNHRKKDKKQVHVVNNEHTEKTGEVFNLLFTSMKNLMKHNL